MSHLSTPTGPPPPKSVFQRQRLSSILSDTADLAEALKLANYADIVKQLDHHYGQGMRIFQLIRILLALDLMAN